MSTPSPHRSRVHLDPLQLRALLVCALVLSEVVIGQLSVFYSPPDTQVAMFWPTAGISVVALVLSRPAWRPTVLAGIGAGVTAANALGGRPLDVSLAYGLLNVVGATTAVWILTHGGRKRPELQGFEDCVRLVAAGVGGGLAAAAIGALAMNLLQAVDPFEVARALAAAHVSAIVLIAPLGLALPSHGRQAGRFEAALQWTALAVSLVMAFRPGQELPLTFTPFPFLVWGAVRLKPREVSVQLVALFAAVSVLTSAGYGPVVRSIELAGGSAQLIGTVLQAQVFAAVLVALPLSLIRTQHLITVDRLTHSHDLVNNILDSTTATAILGTDLDGRIEFFNVGAERLTGYRASEVIGSASLALRDFGDGRMRLAVGVGETPNTERLQELVEPFLDNSATHFTSDWDLVRHDGEVRTISVAVSRRYGDDGEVRGYLGVADDVTDRRNHEAKVEAALESERQVVERLAQVDQTKNDFISTVSHELRTPITSIIGYSQLLVTDTSGVLPARHQQVIGRIERNGRRLLGLIEDMLTMSQLEGSSPRFEKASIDLRDPVRYAMEDVQGLYAVRDLTLDVELCPDPIPVNGDRDKLERVVVNLLTNAAKFSPAGTEVHVELVTDGQEAVLRVIDSGIGIGPEEQPHVFDRFFRGAGAQALAIQGAGLGLPVARSIVTGHDGRIEVDSELGQGSTFAVRLPLLAEQADPTEATEPTAPAAPAQKKRRTRRSGGAAA